MSRRSIRSLVAVGVFLTLGAACGLAGGAMTDHFRDAIRLNQARRPLYAELSGGESLAVSRRLILFEKAALPAALAIDALAHRFQRAGVPVVSLDLVPMADVPAFAESGPSQPLSDFTPVDGRTVARRLRAALRAGGFAGVSRAVFIELARLEGQPRFHALLRHMLESIRRVANLAPCHERLARSLKVGSTRTLSRMMLESHFLVLGESCRIDVLAAPVQARGLPIVAQDVPPIPPTSPFYGTPRP